MRKRGRRMANQKYDEDFRSKIEIEYRTNPSMTLRGLSKIYGISESTLKKWKSEDAWDLEREQYMNKTKLKATEQISTKQAESLTHINNMAVGAVETWLSAYDPNTPDGAERIKNASVSEIKLIKELIQITGHGQPIRAGVINLTQNNIKGMTDEELENARNAISKEVQYDG
ncbi:MAG: hypothetical protein EOM05_09290 [Clostridia bacterium]|nr:hypothetical protein [Clostridia bacterium]